MKVIIWVATILQSGIENNKLVSHASPLVVSGNAKKHEVVGLAYERREPYPLSSPTISVDIFELTIENGELVGVERLPHSNDKLQGPA